MNPTKTFNEGLIVPHLALFWGYRVHHIRPSIVAFNATHPQIGTSYCSCVFLWYVRLPFHNIETKKHQLYNNLHSIIPQCALGLLIIFFILSGLIFMFK